MQELLKEAVKNLQQVQNGTISNFSEEFDDKGLEECDCSDLYDKIEELEQTTTIYDINYDPEMYLGDDLDIEVFVNQTLMAFNIPTDEIDNYVTETQLSESFLEVEDINEDDFSMVISLEKDKLVSYLLDVEANY